MGTHYIISDHLLCVNKFLLNTVLEFGSRYERGLDLILLKWIKTLEWGRCPPWTDWIYNEKIRSCAPSVVCDPLAVTHLCPGEAHITWISLKSHTLSGLLSLQGLWPSLKIMFWNLTTKHLELRKDLPGMYLSILNPCNTVIYVCNY